MTSAEATETTADRQRRLARERQQRRRSRLAAAAEPLAERYCLACCQLFQPRRRDSWLCSRRCVDRVSYHRKRATGRKFGAFLREICQELHGEQNPLTVAQLVERWGHYPREAEAAYSLWFPDLCGLTAEQAQADREQFQRLCRKA